MLVIFLFLWLLFYGQVNLEIFLIGIIVSVIIYRFCHLWLGYSIKTDVKIMRNIYQGIIYFGILVIETVKANLSVSAIVFARELEVEPQIVFFRTDLQTQASRVILANSITLTPGTLTVALHDDLFCVHCLNSQMAAELKDSQLVRQLRKMEQMESELSGKEQRQCP